MAAMIWNSMIDHIPLWGWLVIIALPTGALLFYFGPILLPIWHVLPNWLKALLIFIGGLGLAFLGGRYRGRANAEDEQRKRDAQAIQKRTEVDSEVGNLSDKETADRLRNKWTRD